MFWYVEVSQAEREFPQKEPMDSKAKVEQSAKRPSSFLSKVQFQRDSTYQSTSIRREIFCIKLHPNGIKGGKMFSRGY